MLNEVRVAGSRGGGYWYTSGGSKNQQGQIGNWWSSEGNRWNLNYNNTNLNGPNSNDGNGYSVRCVRNLTGAALLS